jgi:hypothetical protein
MRELGVDEAVQADVLFGGRQGEAAVDFGATRTRKSPL